MGKADRVRFRDCATVTGYTFSLFLVGAGILANSLQDSLGWRYNVSFLAALGSLVLAVNAGLWWCDQVRAFILDSLPTVRR